MLVRWLLHFLCFLIIAEGDYVEDRIIGGYKVAKNSVKYMASIQGPSGHFCGGTLVNPQWVLTAAHCFYPISTLTIILGLYNLSLQEPTSQKFSVISVALHPQFNSKTLNYDAMLLKLHVKVIQTVAVKPVIMPKQGSTFRAPLCTAYGWGVTRTNGFALSDTLQGVDIPVVNHTECNHRYRGAITENMVCAGVENKDTCKGDSGGPFVCNGVLQGITSWGYSCASQYPGVYTRVANIRAWILNILAIK
ncbi:trypsin-like isoform X1 [Pleurodeles waltl]